MRRSPVLPRPISSVSGALIVLYVALATSMAAGSERVEIGPALRALAAVQREGEGHREAIAAWQIVVQAGVDQLPEVLAGMDQADILGCNWIRAAVDTITQRQLAQGGELPLSALEQFLADTNHAPRARRLAYELVARVDTTARKRLIPGLLDDPSLELRRDAVAMALEEAQSLATRDPAAGTRAYQRALAAARDIDQCQAAAAGLRKLGADVNLADHLGFLLNWELIGPFDNSGGVGYDTVYPPEQEINLSAEYRGKLGSVRWTDFTTRDDYGVVDLNEAYGRAKTNGDTGYADTPESLPKFKGTIAYACTEFLAQEPRDVEIRLGCINGHKVWLNGALVIENHVFHAGMVIDQYRGQGRLQAGRNVLLVKIAQNEQSQDWAQNWQFQLRLSDTSGAAILSSDRKRVP
jgi:hypothetical protein